MPVGKGRPPTPHEILLLEGTFRPDKHGDPQAEVVAEGDPVPPATLSKAALAHWNEVVPRIMALGVAKAADADALGVLCEWKARYDRLSKIFDKMSPTNKQFHRTMLQLSNCSERWRQLALEFGLTSLARTKMRRPVKEAKEAGVASRKRGG